MSLLDCVLCLQMTALERTFFHGSIPTCTSSSGEGTGVIEALQLFAVAMLQLTPYAFEQGPPCVFMQIPGDFVS